MTVRVVLADDQEVVRAGLRTILELADEITVVGEAADGLAAVELARALVPDVVLMDVRMPVLDGIEATRAIAADPALRSVRVVMLTTFDHDDHLFAALQAGASGYLLKDLEGRDLIRAVRTVAGGAALLDPAITERVIQEAAQRSDPRPVDARRLDVLTPRERDIVALVARGLSNDDIARTLVISPHTAKTHVNRAMAKLRARDRAQLVIIGYETGLVRTGGSTSPPAPC